MRGRCQAEQHGRSDYEFSFHDFVSPYTKAGEFRTVSVVEILARRGQLAQRSYDLAAIQPFHQRPSVARAANIPSRLAALRSYQRRQKRAMAQQGGLSARAPANDPSEAWARRN